MLKRDIQLEISIDENLPAVDAQPMLIRKVIANLLDNAIKYNREAGTYLYIRKSRR